MAELKGVSLGGWLPPPDIPKRNLVSAALSSGIDDFQGTLYGLGGAVADTVGATGVRDWMNKQADRNQLESRLNGRPDLENVEDQSLGSVPSWALYQTLKQAPNIAGTIAATFLTPEIALPAAAGRALAYVPRVLGGGGMTGRVAEATAKGASVLGAQREALRAGATLGNTLVKGGAFNYGTGVGSLYNEAVEGGNPDAGVESLIKGVPYALAETAPEAMLFGRIAHGSGFQGGLLKRMGKSALTQGTSGAVSELSQTGLENSMRPDEGEGSLSADQIRSKYLNAGATGFAVEALMGSLGGIRGPRTRAKLEANAPVNLITETSPKQFGESVANRWNAPANSITDLDGNLPDGTKFVRMANGAIDPKAHASTQAEYDAMMKAPSGFKVADAKTGLERELTVGEYYDLQERARQQGTPPKYEGGIDFTTVGDGANWSTALGATGERTGATYSAIPGIDLLHDQQQSSIQNQLIDPNSPFGMAGPARTLDMGAPASILDLYGLDSSSTHPNTLNPTAGFPSIPQTSVVPNANTYGVGDGWILPGNTQPQGTIASQVPGLSAQNTNPEIDRIATEKAAEAKRIGAQLNAPTDSWTQVHALYSELEGLLKDGHIDEATFNTLAANLKTPQGGKKPLDIGSTRRVISGIKKEIESAKNDPKLAAPAPTTTAPTAQAAQAAPAATTAPAPVRVNTTAEAANVLFGENKPTQAGPVTAAIEPKPASAAPAKAEPAPAPTAGPVTTAVEPKPAPAPAPAPTAGPVSTAVNNALDKATPGNTAGQTVGETKPSAAQPGSVATPVAEQSKPEPAKPVAPIAIGPQNGKGQLITVKIMGRTVTVKDIHWNRVKAVLGLDDEGHMTQPRKTYEQVAEAEGLTGKDARGTINKSLKLFGLDEKKIDSITAADASWMAKNSVSAEGEQQNEPVSEDGGTSPTLSDGSDTKEAVGGSTEDPREAGGNALELNTNPAEDGGDNNSGFRIEDTFASAAAGSTWADDSKLTKEDKEWLANKAAQDNQLSEEDQRRLLEHNARVTKANEELAAKNGIDIETGDDAESERESADQRNARLRFEQDARTEWNSNIDEGSNVVAYDDLSPEHKAEFNDLYRLWDKGEIKSREYYERFTQLGESATARPAEVQRPGAGQGDGKTQSNAGGKPVASAPSNPSAGGAGASTQSVDGSKDQTGSTRPAEAKNPAGAPADGGQKPVKPADTKPTAPAEVKPSAPAETKPEAPAKTVAEEAKDKWDAHRAQFPEMPAHDDLTKNQKKRWEDLVSRKVDNLAAAAKIAGESGQAKTVDLTKAETTQTAPAEQTTTPAEAPAATTAETPALAAPTAEAINAAVEKLPGTQIKTLEDELKAKRGSKVFTRRLSEQIANYVTKGAEAVAARIRGIVKQMAEGVMAVAMIFNPNVTAHNFAFDLPRIFSTNVQIKADVPTVAVGNMSVEARKTYENLAPRLMKSGKAFAIMDKNAGMIHWFNPDGSLLVQGPAISGKDKGDVLQGNSLLGAKKITPAGTYTLEHRSGGPYAEYNGKAVFALKETDDGEGVIAVHAVWVGDPKEMRQQRLDRGSPEAKRISYGCVNTTNDMFLKHLLPNAEKLNGGTILVLPEERAKTGSMFPGESQTEVTVETGRRTGTSETTATRDITGSEEKRHFSRRKVIEDVTAKLRNWWGRSADNPSVSDNGKPKIFYHGTARDVTTFKPKQAGAVFLTDKPKFADGFAERSKQWVEYNLREVLSGEENKALSRAYDAWSKVFDLGMGNPEYEAAADRLLALKDSLIAKYSGENVMPLIVRAEKTFDYDNADNVKEVAMQVQRESSPFSRDRYILTSTKGNQVGNHLDMREKFGDGVKSLIKRLQSGDWQTVESVEVQRAIKALGYDSFHVKEGGVKNLAVYDPNQVKSAIGNNGNYSLTDNDIHQQRSFSNTFEFQHEAADRTGGISPARPSRIRSFPEAVRNALFARVEGALDRVGITHWYNALADVGTMWSEPDGTIRDMGGQAFVQFDEKKGSYRLMVADPALQKASSSERGWIEGQETVGHEMFHVIDDVDHGQVYSTQPEVKLSAVWNRENGNLDITGEGTVSKEIVDLYNQSLERLKSGRPVPIQMENFIRMLAYPLMIHISDEMNSNGMLDGPYTEGGVHYLQSEMLAQVAGIFSATEKGRAWMAKNLPQTHQFLTEVYNDAAQTDAKFGEDTAQQRYWKFAERNGGPSPQASGGATGMGRASGGRFYSRGGGTSGVGGTSGSAPPRQAPRQAQEVGRRLAGDTGARAVNDASHFVKKLANSLRFLHDIVEDAAKQIPAAKKWYAAVQESLATRNNLQQDAERIAAMADKLPDGTGAVNDFISRSTYEQKWGYDPKYPGKTVTIDPEMQRAYLKLSAQERAVVQAVFKHGMDMVAKKDAIIKALGISDAFTPSTRLDGPYAPLKRFGNYLGILKSAQLRAAEDADDKELVAKLKADPAHYMVSSFDTIGQAKQFAYSNDAANGGKWAFADAFEKPVRAEEGRMMPHAALQKVLSALKVDANVPANARDAVTKMVTDMYFQTLDEHNARTSGLKRLNRAGYDSDMIRSFLSHAKAEAGFLANLQHGGEINGQFYEMSRQTKNAKGYREAQDAFNMMAEHYADSLDYRETPWQDRAMAMTSAWQLATSIGYHLNNATQPFMTTVPKLAADFNDYGGAWKHVLAGYKTLASTGTWGNIDISKVSDAGLRGALQRASDMGVLDVGMAEDLSHFERTRTGYGAVDAASGVAKRALHLLRQVSRSVEVANRVSSATAAYNMAIASGKSVQQAQDYAVNILQTTQGDFSRTGAPLLLKKLPKVTTQYKKFQLMVASLYANAFRQAFAGADATTRAIGKRMLAYKMFHTGAAAGVLGMPMINLVAAAFSAMGGDDEPPDLERSLRDAIGDKDMADVLLHGPLYAIGLGGLGTKLGDDKVFSIMPYGNWDFSSKSAMLQTAGSLMGPAVSQAGQFAEGIGFMGRGDYYRGVEKMMPKGVSSAMEAFRTANEGFQLKNGDVMFKPEDVNGMAMAMDALGVPSSQMTDMKWLRSQQYEVTQFYQQKSKQLEHDYVEAYRDGDVEKQGELRKAWTELQNGKDELRHWFGDSHESLKRQPLSTLIRAPHNQSLREGKLQKAAVIAY